MNEQVVSPLSQPDMTPLPDGAAARAVGIDATMQAKLTARPLRILLPSYRSHPHTGGQGVYIRHLSKSLVDLGHHVDVISGPPYPELDPRVGLIKLPSLDLYAQPKPLLGFPRAQWGSAVNWIEYLSFASGGFPEPLTFGRRLVDYLRQTRASYDIIHDNQTLCTGLLELRDMGYRVISTIHHPITKDRALAIAAQKNPWYKFLVWRWHFFLNMQQRVARALDDIVVVSQSTYRDLIDEFGLRPAQMEVILEGIETEKFHPLSDVARKPNRLMATASADVALKGLVYLIRAYARLLPEFPDLELVVVGSLRKGPTDDLLQQLGIKDRVRFVSGITDADINKLYAEATVAVSPSLYEGFGFPAGEAMAAGVPLVATTGGALPEVVGDAGVLVPPGDAAALADGIAALLRDPARRAHLSEAGRARVLREFQWSRVGMELTQYYYARMDRHADN